MAPAATPPRTVLPDLVLARHRHACLLAGAPGRRVCLAIAALCHPARRSNSPLPLASQRTVEVSLRQRGVHAYMLVHWGIWFVFDEKCMCMLVEACLSCFGGYVMGTCLCA